MSYGELGNALGALWIAKLNSENASM